MKEPMNSGQVIERINQLLREGKKLMMFGLGYPPYKELVVYTDTLITRRDHILLDSGVSVPVQKASSIKIHTLTGWVPLFKYAENGTWVETIIDDKWVGIDIFEHAHEVCPGMLLSTWGGPYLPIMGFELTEDTDGMKFLATLCDGHINSDVTLEGIIGIDSVQIIDRIL